MAVVLVFGTAAVTAMRTALKLKRNAKEFVLNLKESVSSTTEYHFQTTKKFSYLNTERCNLPKVNGSCEGYFLQWYYDKQARQCSQFVYGGCLGNNNRFESREECSELCSKDDSAGM